MRLIDADYIVEVAERAYDAWNLAMATQDTNRGINKILKRQELCKAVKDVADDAPIIDPETLPIVKELREQLAGITAERDAAVEALAKARSCEACAHAGEVSSGACETADYECAACAAVCVCKDCREGSLWKWKGGSGHEIP